MSHSLDWRLCAARIEGLIPFISEELSEIVALASIRRAWFYFDRDFPFEIGLDHETSPDGREIMLSWYDEERNLFLSWLLSKAGPVIRKAAARLMRAKNYGEKFSAKFLDVDVLCVKLDDLLPTSDPLSLLDNLVDDLRDSVQFLEAEPEPGKSIYDTKGKKTGALRPGPRGDYWAAGLAISSRPEIFRLGNAPLLISGIISPLLFRRLPEMPASDALRMNMATAFDEIWQDIADIHRAMKEVGSQLEDLYASSRAFDAWKFAYAIGPINRFELARALQVTPKTAYRAVQVLVERDLAELQGGRYVIAKAP